MPAALSKVAGQPRDDDAGAVVELARFALPSAISSGIVFGPSLARTVSSEVFFAASVIGAKSLNGS